MKNGKKILLGIMFLITFSFLAQTQVSKAASSNTITITKNMNKTKTANKIYKFMKANKPFKVIVGKDNKSYNEMYGIFYSIMEKVDKLEAKQYKLSQTYSSAASYYSEIKYSGKKRIFVYSKKKIKEYHEVCKMLITIQKEINATQENYRKDNADKIQRERLTKSEIKAEALQTYFKAHMSYAFKEGGLPDIEYYYTHYESEYAVLKEVHKGTFKGVCSHGADAGYKIARALGYNVKVFSNVDENHAWLGMKVSNSIGEKYYKGISTSSYAHETDSKGNIIDKSVSLYDGDYYMLDKTIELDETDTFTSNYKISDVTVSDTSIISVSADHTITALKPGETTITLKLADKYTRDFRVTVVAKEYFIDDEITMQRTSFWNLSALLKTYVPIEQQVWTISDPTMGYMEDSNDFRVLDKSGTFTLTLTVDGRDYSKEIRVE